ncbi:MAG: nitrile hydratase subunit alpha [bacterium]
MSQTTAAIRAQALESLLIEKGLLDADRIDDVIVRYNERVGPMNGAQLVARAWVDNAFRERLLTDATAVVNELEFSGGQVDKLVVVENTTDVHNVVVCTLCSCYPWAVLGLPPKWYKDPAYRSRVVREPRLVLEEFGTHIPAQKKIRVWDSSAEIRYMVLPEMPSGWQGRDVDRLAELVSRDSMIGVTVLGER